VGTATVCRLLFSDSFLLALAGVLWVAYLVLIDPGPRPLDTVPAEETRRNPIPSR
jgi:hypothetical protein